MTSGKRVSFEIIFDMHNNVYLYERIKQRISRPSNGAMWQGEY